MTSPLTIPEIEAAIDTIVEHRNAILRGKTPYNPGAIRKIEDDLRDLRRIWSEIGSDEAIKEVNSQFGKGVMPMPYKSDIGTVLSICTGENGQNSDTITDPKAHTATLTELKPRSRQMPDWLREHEKIT